MQACKFILAFVEEDNCFYERSRYLCFSISVYNAEIYAYLEALSWVYFQHVPSKMRAKATVILGEL